MAPTEGDEEFGAHRTADQKQDAFRGVMWNSICIWVFTCGCCLSGDKWKLNTLVSDMEIIWKLFNFNSNLSPWSIY